MTVNKYLFACLFGSDINGVGLCAAFMEQVEPTESTESTQQVAKTKTFFCCFIYFIPSSLYSLV